MMAMTLTFEQIKYWYDHRYWSITRVRNAVVMGVITSEQFTEITGQPYIQ